MLTTATDRVNCDVQIYFKTQATRTALHCSQANQPSVNLSPEGLNVGKLIDELLDQAGNISLKLGEDDKV